MEEMYLEKNEVSDDGLIPYEQSLKLAQQIYAEFEEQIVANLNKEIDGVRELKDYPNLIRYYLKKVPDDIAERFQGHGMEKADNPLAAVLNIMANKTIRGDWGKLRKSGYIDAYDSGNFLIISKKDQSLGIHGADKYHGTEHLRPVSNKMGSVVEIGAVVCGAEFYPVVERLRELFPEINIIKASEMPNYLNQ